PYTWGSPRSRSISSILLEIESLLDLGVHRIVLEAPDFLDFHRGTGLVSDPCQPAANIEEITKLLNAINSHQSFSEGIAHLSIENMKSCLFDEKVASVLSETLPETSPNIGLETGSEEHLHQIGKCGTANDVLRAVRIAKQYGMTPFVYLIYGLPGETPETIKKSIELMNELEHAGVERIILYGFRALPGSAFADFPEPNPKDPATYQLRKAAARINRARKRDYVDKVLRGVAAEPSWERHGYTMVYPLREGPLMTVIGGYTPGTIMDVRVTKVLSSGLVLGEVVTWE
ncbi:MAG: radical SAM protein, partial [Candidatus Hodarchaeota archaeon]